MKQLGTAFIRGLATILPLALTIYIVYTLAQWSESLIGGLMRDLVGNLYFPGLGVIMGVVIVMAIGVVTRLPLFNIVFKLGDAVLSRMPLISSLYTTIRDLTDFIAGSDDATDRGKPVLVDIAEGIQVVGLVTDNESTIAGENNPQTLVYLPMSYQLGGYTVAIDRDKLTPLDMSVEDAMTFVVTAGVRKR